MTNCDTVMGQLNAIMEALSKSAVVEISKLFNDIIVVLRLEISESQRENQELKRKLMGIQRDMKTEPADLEQGPPLIKEERCEEDWGGSDPPTQQGSCPERGGAEDLGCSHWMSRPADAPPVGGARELSEDEELGGDTSTEDSHSQGGAGYSLAPPSASVKQEALGVPGWGEGLEAGRPEEAGLQGGAVSAQELRPHRCEHCEERFARPGELRAHERTHTERSGLSCTHCGKTFARRYYLRIHQRYHTGEQLLPCAQCDMSFACRHHLRQHQKCHSGEKPFSCPTCGKDFSRKYNLKEHQKIHTGERPHGCTACGKSFKQLSTLKTHQRSHNGETFSCVCGKSFNRKYVLKVHQRIHTGERPYSCSGCGKSFTQPCVLRSHMRTHCGGNRPAAFRNTCLI
ncbi:hypothetical protein COCON_G00000130 [Conger conger]|uniref:C2H2-type domain-containing protein n=1 Tax=Conger conger TaxID=82655 RepID=A0A9Q1I775_CONCO|nr:hypothetical protein COCON_G00000130 [Conger conger]